MARPESVHGSPDDAPDGGEAIVARLLAMIAARPSAVAMCWDGRTLRYADLDRRSARIASCIAARGVQPGALVGICCDRSFGPVVAALAAMRLGCAFTQIDPGDPAARRAAILADAGAALFVADERHALVGERPCLLIDAIGELAPGADPAGTTPPAPLPHPPAPRDLAYIVYTSGSSGLPKGAEITHANFTHLVDWTIRRFDLTATDRGSHVAGLGFDAAIWEVWPLLVAGAAVHVADEMTRTSPALLRDWMLHEQISFAFVPTALAEAMIVTPWPTGGALRYLLTGGDTLRTRPAPGLPFPLVNNYGPCECTVLATSGVVTPFDDTGALPDIGSPIDGVQVHILDEDGLPVGAGEEGEIWIGGRGVGRGYRNRAELTAAAFVPDPFGDAPDAMLYRTGDRGMRAPNGKIQFRGRFDRQVKVRGVRIELDEVATLLRRHPAVTSAAITARPDAQGALSLCAYVTLSAVVAPPSDADLRAFLEERLPATHLPSAFVRLDAMPLTRSGKLDVAALPEPPARPMLVEGGDPGEYSPTQTGVAAIVKRVLGLSDLPIDTDFFLVGGHSLLATQVVIQCRQAFDVSLTLRDLFEAPTIEGFAALIDGRVALRIAPAPDGPVRPMLAVPPG